MLNRFLSFKICFKYVYYNRYLDFVKCVKIYVWANAETQHGFPFLMQVAIYIISVVFIHICLHDLSNLDPAKRILNFFLTKLSQYTKYKYLQPINTEKLPLNGPNYWKRPNDLIKKNATANFNLNCFYPRIAMDIS